MAESQKRINADELESGDKVTVRVNGRASRHLGEREFEAVVEATGIASIQFKRIDEGTLHTWYTDIGYIDGHHKRLGRHSDIGRVEKVTYRE